ncbi:hypothetical protein D3C75_1152620 [compost metagenome]
MVCTGPDRKTLRTRLTDGFFPEHAADQRVLPLKGAKCHRQALRIRFRHSPDAQQGFNASLPFLESSLNCAVLLGHGYGPAPF